MSDVLPSTGWQIEIKQRGGKWVFWCFCATDLDRRITWDGIGALRRKARCVHLEDGKRTVMFKYEPPELML